jgi:hypothetical protein
MYTEFDLIAGRIRIKINLNDKKKIEQNQTQKKN